MRWLRVKLDLLRRRRKDLNGSSPRSLRFGMNRLPILRATGARNLSMSRLGRESRISLSFESLVLEELG